MRIQHYVVSYIRSKQLRSKRQLGKPFPTAHDAIFLRFIAECSKTAEPLDDTVPMTDFEAVGGIFYTGLYLFLETSLRHDDIAARRGRPVSC